MIIVMKPKTPAIEIQRISEEIGSWNLNLIAEKSIGKHQVVIGLIGDTTELEPSRVQALSPFIEQVVRIEKAFKRASREFRHGEPSIISLKTPNGIVEFGQDLPVVQIAGPCAVESEKMIVATAQKLKQAGAKFLRGGAYKPRTSPYAFQGHGEQALEFLATARAETGLGIITEVMNVSDLDTVAAVTDIIQIGARNMQNYSLLKKVGEQPKPVLLKRGMCATVKEWLLAAEYIIAAGNPQVILCERGVRSFDNQYTRNILDLSVIPVLRTLTHLPIAVDPSHGTGKAEYVPAMAKAAIAAGADALMIEVHPNPAEALSDGPQSLKPEEYQELMQEMLAVGQVSNCRDAVPPAPGVLAAV
jgi:3-deoxy-7-phosphoheptulonate synthase